MQIYFPYQIADAGRTATTNDADHVRDLIEQVLFTSPGERVNRPTFGAGLQQLLFGPSSDEVATATEFVVQSALLQWLGDLIRVEAVTVGADEATLTVTVRYLILSNQQRAVDTFERQVFSV